MDEDDYQKVIHAELDYPGIDEESVSDRYVEVDLIHTRATDGLRIYYDFGRNGWIIKQASTFDWSIDDHRQDEDWQEVAFVESWGREGKMELLEEENREMKGES